MKEKLFYSAFLILICSYVIGTVLMAVVITKQNDVLTSRNNYLETRVHYLDSTLDNHKCKLFKHK